MAPPATPLPWAYPLNPPAPARGGQPRQQRPPALMLTIGKSANAEESKIAADYFASFPFKPWIRVAAVTDLTIDDLVSIAAYTASRTP